MTRDEFFGDPIMRWFSSAASRIAVEWFAAAWRTNPKFREAVTSETKRYVWKVGVLADPVLLAFLKATLNRAEILAFYEELRQQARGRVLEWGAEFEKAFAAHELVLPVPVSELDSVGECLYSAIKERDLERVRFLVRCMRDVGLDPEQATFEECVCDSTRPLDEMTEAELECFMATVDSLPIRHVPVIEYAKSERLAEFVAVLCAGGGRAESSAVPDSVL